MVEASTPLGRRSIIRPQRRFVSRKLTYFIPDLSIAYVNTYTIYFISLAPARCLRRVMHPGGQRQDLVLAARESERSRQHVHAWSPTAGRRRSLAIKVFAVCLLTALANTPPLLNSRISNLFPDDRAIYADGYLSQFDGKAEPER